MFFVFGPMGQMYRGGPEQLAQVSPVRRVQRPQPSDPRGSGFAGPTKKLYVACTTAGRLQPRSSSRLSRRRMVLVWFWRSK